MTDHAERVAREIVQDVTTRPAGTTGASIIAARLRQWAEATEVVLDGSVPGSMTGARAVYQEDLDALRAAYFALTKPETD